MYLRFDIFQVYLVQLESQFNENSLTLHKFLYFIRPTMSIFEILANAVTIIINKSLQGAQILTFLYEKFTELTGDANTQTIICHLTELATVPYIEMLQLWILKGVILDPKSEFLVEDNEVIHRDLINVDHYSAEYWEKRYTLRRDKIPIFFEAHSDKILRAGKYLNVIRQCGSTRVASIQMDDLTFSPTNPSGHTVCIENAYTFAARNLLKVLVKDNDLMGHLKSVKRYLLLQQGDFINQFMDASEKELNKNVDKVLPMRLENLLGLTLRLSSAKYDKYNEDLHCQLFPFELVKQMEKINLAGPTDEGKQNKN